jgi:hypothetical protein
MRLPFLTALAAVAVAPLLSQTSINGIPNQTISAKQDVMDAASFCSDAGSTDAYACSLSAAITSYVTGTHYRFKANTANSGAATINLNSLGAKTIKKATGGVTTDLSDNDIRAGQWVDLVYDGTNMQMTGALGAQTVTYYVDSGSGSDSNSGLTTGAPWQTIAKVNAQGFPAGTTILFRRGQSWSETLIIPTSGTASAPINYGAYDTGANPVIVGSDAQTGFVLSSAAIYVKSSFTNDPRQVFEDGVRYQSKGSTGAMVAGSYFWDSGANNLYVWTSNGANPNTHTIETTATRLYGIDFNGKGYVNVDSIDVLKSGKEGFAFEVQTGANNITVTNATSSWNQDRGFSIGGYTPLGTFNIVFRNDIGHDNLGEGFWIGNGTSNGVVGCEAYNNGKDVYNLGLSGFGGGIVVGSYATNNYVKYSYIHDIYYNYPLFVEHENHAGVQKPTGTVISGNLIANNKVTLTATVIDEGTNSLFTYNVIYTSDTGNGDLVLLRAEGGTGTAPSGATFYNNTFYMGVAAFGTALDSQSSSGTTFKNNIVYSIATGGSNGDILDLASATSFTSDYNRMTDSQFHYSGAFYQSVAAFSSASGTDTHSNSNPVNFVNGPLHDLRLLSGSSAIGSGIALSDIYRSGLSSASSVWPGPSISQQNLAAWNIGAYIGQVSQYSSGVNAQTGTSYTVAATDENKLVTFSNASSIAVTLPVATASGFTSGATFSVFNKGVGVATITPTTSTINGATTLVLNQNDGATIYSDGTNYSALTSQSLTSKKFFVASSDFTTANNTNLQTITGLSWVLPANTALNVPFRCYLAFSQATAAVADSFGIQSATISPTNIFATGEIHTNTTAATYGNLPTLSTSTATAIVTATPSAITTVWNAELRGFIENPSNASANTINIMVKTATGADAVTVKRGSFCVIQ